MPSTHSSSAALVRASHSRTRVFPDNSHGMAGPRKPLACTPRRSASHRARGRWKSSVTITQWVTPNVSRARITEKRVRSPAESIVIAETGTPRSTRPSRMSRGSL